MEIRNKLQEALKENAEKGSVRKRMTVRRWYTEWMEVYKVPVIRPNTKRHYEHIFDALILPELADMYLDDVRQIHIKGLVNQLEERGYQWETQNKVRILLLDMFNIAIENDYAYRNPAKGIRLAKNRPNDRVVLTVEQQEDFFECSAGTFYDHMFVVAINTGLRPGELSVTKTLLYQKLDGDEGKAFHIGPPKTGSSVRTVPMNQACEEALRKQIRLKKMLSLKYVQDNEFRSLLFVTKFNTPICSVVLNEAIKRIVAEINLQRDEIDQFPIFSAHTFRHSFATRCMEVGIQMRTIQSYLGHASLQMTTDLYVHATEEFKQKELEKLGDISFMRSRENSIRESDG